MIYIISGVISEGKAIKIMFTTIIQILSAIAFGIEIRDVQILLMNQKPHHPHHALSAHSTRQRVHILLLLEVYY